MGKNNQQRRAAKRKARAAGRSQPPGPGRHNGRVPDDGGPDHGPTFGGRMVFGQRPSPEAEATALITSAASAAGDSFALDNAVRDIVVFTGTVGQNDPLLTSRAATTLLLRQVGVAYEHGWQPADLVHVARRELGTRLAKLAATVVLEQGLLERAPARAPDEWVGQLEALTDAPLSARAPSARPWNVMVDSNLRLALWDSWHDILGLLGHWFTLAAMPRLLAPPSSWSRQRAAPTVVRRESGHDPKKLTIIRALLAKAEATEFEEEADAFTAKAQDLMTRYAIDEALLVDEADNIEIRSRRVHVDNPYASTKAQLLATVGKVNRVKAIWDDQHGIATIVGLPVDLDLAEMLFTSLLVQATRAMTEAGAASRGGHRLDRAPSFRRAFLLSYAQRIGERLSTAGAQAQQEESDHRGRNLLPVLARQSAAVDTEFQRLFPNTTQSSTTRVDVRGWNAGRAAADRAVLARAQVDGRSA